MLFCMQFSLLVRCCCDTFAESWCFYIIFVFVSINIAKHLLIHFVDITQFSLDASQLPFDHLSYGEYISGNKIHRNQE